MTQSIKRWLNVILNNCSNLPILVLLETTTYSVRTDRSYILLNDHLLLITQNRFVLNRHTNWVPVKSIIVYRSSTVSGCLRHQFRAHWLRKRQAYWRIRIDGCKKNLESKDVLISQIMFWLLGQIAFYSRYKEENRFWLGLQIGMCCFLRIFLPQQR